MNNNVFTATLTITSNGTDNKVTLSRELSHDVTQMLIAGQELPAAYRAMQDIERFVHMVGSQEKFLLDDEALADMTEEEILEEARMVAAQAENTMVAERIDYAK